MGRKPLDVSAKSGVRLNLKQDSLGIFLRDGIGMRQKAVYERIFTYGSLQFCGHMEEYLVERTKVLSVFIVQPRHGVHTNILRRYVDGACVEEREIRSSQNLFLYYFLWYINHMRELLRFCPKDRLTLVFGGHPIVFFGMGLLRMLRPLRFAYWIGDYFPSRHPVIRLYEWVKKRYQRRVDFAYYLTDSINRVMNGTVVSRPARRTVMWGLKPFPVSPMPPLEPFHLLFVGLIRPGQGLEALLEFVEGHAGYRLSLIGVGQASYVKELKERVRMMQGKDRVFFPNRFYSEAELWEVARTCHVGIALYDTAGSNFTHYADPGKVKAYAEMHLPVIMTRISDIVPYVERFHSGEVIEDGSQIACALERVRSSYVTYLNGVGAFVEYFEYEHYYREAFKSIEGCWK